MTSEQNQIGIPSDIPCPECDNLIKIDEEISIGDILECGKCGSENEVIKLNPVILTPLEEEK